MKKTGILKTILFLLIFIFTYSCYNDSEEQLYPILNTNCDTSNVTYKNTISVIMGSNCTSCHGASALANGYKIDLSTYTLVQTNIDKIIGAVDHQSGFPPMPPTGAKMNTCKITQFKIWQKNGSLNN